MEHVIYIYILAMGENSLISWCEWGYALGHHSLLGVATLLEVDCGVIKRDIGI